MKPDLAGYKWGNMTVNTVAVRKRANAAANTQNGPVNVLRAVAAGAVVLGHARILFMQDFDEVPQNAVQTLVYGLTSLGHQAVVVFFVLSGFWVGGSAVSSITRGSFTWPRYLTNRLTRMWVVFLPALLLTLLFDLVGRHYFGHMSAYAGDIRYGGVAMDQRPLDGLTLLGNAVFMQAIHVSTLGSNTALWSLSYELWLYILAPLVFLIVWKRGRSSITYGVVALVVGFVVGAPVLAYLPLWGLGAVVSYFQPSLVRALNGLMRWQLVGLRGIAALLALGAAVGIRGFNSLPTIVGDYIVAVPAAILLGTLVTGFVPNGLGQKLLGPYSRLAESSFSLYAIHLPFLFLLVSALGIQVGNRWPSDLRHWLLLLAVVAGTVALGWVFAQGTERHTDKVRDLVKAKLNAG